MSKLIRLTSHNDAVETTSQEVLSCGTCKNKTWIAVYEATGEGFARMKCAVCGESAGHFGWIDAARRTEK